MKFRRTLFVINVLSIACIFCLQIVLKFRYQEIENILSCSKSDVDEFQILNMSDGTISAMLRSDENICLDLLFSLRVAYRPDLGHGIRYETGEHVYELVLANESGDSYQEINTVVIAPNGSLYLDNSKYVIDGQHEETIELLEQLCFDLCKVNGK